MFPLRFAIYSFVILLTPFVSQLASQIMLLNPNGGENWAAGSYQIFSWKSDLTIELIKLEYSLDAGGDWFLIEDGLSNSGNYLWKGTDEITKQGLLRISNSDDEGTYDMTDGFFTTFKLSQRLKNTIIPKPVTLTIDDVGWHKGVDESKNNGPFR